jgi:hypothetical protein
MAYYLVRARLRPTRVDELRRRLEQGEFEGLRPFGHTLTASLWGARVDPATREVTWEEEDYCAPPLRMEREAVLDRYCDEIRVEPVPEGGGWARIAHLPPLWGAGRGRRTAGQHPARRTR